ncbi:MAG: type II toxin-antitoxin system HicB family antitoxin [Thermodesulfovibrionales bacterium]
MREFTVYQDDDGQWVAQCRELPGVRVRGGSEAEAIEKIKKALLVYYPCRCEE